MKKCLEDASLTPVVLLILGSWSLSAESLVGPGSVGWSIGPGSVGQWVLGRSIDWLND